MNFGGQLLAITICCKCRSRNTFKFKCNGMKSINAIVGLILLLRCGETESGIFQYHRKENKNNIRNGQIESDLLTKMHLTQRGYIQFLRYVEEVPPLTEYTFCLWMKSYNLTHSHPLLSYSKHEEERRIRVWISPRGRAINLEINGIEVFSISMKFREHQWYHICQSWSSDDAVWELFVNGKKKIRGYAPKLFGVPIKPGGDIVVGQEYTDFDKGLEDGIEGDIFGFNFVLSATSSGLTETTDLTNSLVRRSTFSYPMNSQFEYQKNPKRTAILSDPRLDQELLSFNKFDILPKGFKPSRRIISEDHSAIKNFHPKRKNQYYGAPFGSFQSENNRNIHSVKSSKSIGKRLVELSGNCSLGKGAPLRGSKVLISWTKTTVRVFGGAIVKHIKPFC